jgi:hypothetical protein
MKEIAKLDFTDSISGDGASIMIRAVNGLVGLLLTMRHSGDVEVYLTPATLADMQAALMSAIQIASDRDRQTRHPLTTIRSKYPDTNLQAVVTVGVQSGSVALSLALVGDLDEEDEVRVFLDPDECIQLLMALNESR